MWVLEDDRDLYAAPTTAGRSTFHGGFAVDVDGVQQPKMVFKSKNSTTYENAVRSPLRTLCVSLDFWCAS
jgi:hypothetical protein